MRSSLRYFVVACILASALPQLAAASVAWHLLTEHHHHGTPFADGGATTAFLHGHAHTAGTPEHGHPVTAPASSVAASRVQGPLPLALPPGEGRLHGLHAAGDARVERDRRATGRPEQVTPTVLRI